MSFASMTFGRPSRLALPSAAALFTSATARVIAALRRLDHWLLSADRPEPRTADEVLDWARRIENTDPGFAADLRAAALRSMN